MRVVYQWMKSAALAVTVLALGDSVRRTTGDVTVAAR
jgi:hypothetical protein